MALTPVTVNATYLNSDGSPAGGVATFTPSASLIQAGAGIVTVAPKSIVAFGGLTVTLYADDDAGTTPTGQGYLVTENFGPEPVEYSITLSHLVTTVDLAALEHVYLDSVPRFGSSVTDEDFVRSQRLDQLAAPAGALSIGGEKIVNLAAGVYPTDAAAMQDLVTLWVSDTNPWTWVATGTGTAGNQFSMPDSSGFLSLAYSKGLKLQWTDSGGVKFGVLASTSYNSSTHITTMTMIPTVDYPMANSAITAQKYSSASPSNFPSSFTWTPTWTGYSTPPATGGVLDSSWSVNASGGLITCQWSTNTDGTSASGSGGQANSCTAPIAATRGGQAIGWGKDSGTATMISVGILSFTGLTFFKEPGHNGTWTALGSKSVNFSIAYPFT